MAILVTGVAGFIGMHVAQSLLARGETVVGVDNLDPYYEVSLKQARLARLNGHKAFTYYAHDVADCKVMADLAEQHPDIDRVVHLAAQAGVRYSLVNPFAYSHSNLEGFLVMLEFCRRLKSLRHLVYASSSSVYGANPKKPFAIEDRVDNPVSLYAATKKANELMAHCYAHLYGLPMTGLRYFTVYGPWGRPDMSPMLFASKILAGQSIDVYNNGDMRRDYTYIDDVVAGTLAALDRPPQGSDGVPPYRIYNIGNHQSEALMRFIQVMEQALGRKAEIVFKPMQPGDVQETYADISESERDLGYRPATSIEDGVKQFALWYRQYYGL